MIQSMPCSISNVRSMALTPSSDRSAVSKAPLANKLRNWLQTERAEFSRSSLVQAIDYML